MYASLLTDNWGEDFWLKYLEKLKTMIMNFDISYVLEFIVFAVTFYFIFKILRDNKCEKVIAIVSALIVLCGFAFSLSKTLDSTTLTIVIVLIDLMVLCVFNTEIKRSLLGSGNKKHIKR